jgi:hypothetical protein
MLLGGCQCGAVRYQVATEPIQVYVCHCKECRKQSASAFGISVIVPVDAFNVTHGRVRTWSRKTDTGGELVCSFCGICGTRICHADARDLTVSVKGGSLDEPPDLSGAAHIWTSRAMHGVMIPDHVLRFAEEPG